MTAATIRASAAYRKRQAAKMRRYEVTLAKIAKLPLDRPIGFAVKAAREALFGNN